MTSQSGKSSVRRVPQYPHQRRRGAQDRAHSRAELGVVLIHAGYDIAIARSDRIAPFLRAAALAIVGSGQRA